ncbi:hypothetical protein WA026_016989 [Henosepilachna vigintioctopunctata]|uniref:non-specific serine/threonine protein kinase n=1 Tax=Henosepilachna vigintioctopunctata TaxID=420089 RepID=A0AAW1UAG3_9CUCU
MGIVWNQFEKPLKKVNLSGSGRVDASNFETLKVLGTGAYGKVFLVRKRGGLDDGRLYAMKVLKKATIIQKKKTTEHTKTERQVLEAVRDNPFLVTLHYAFQTDARLHLILDRALGDDMEIRHATSMNANDVNISIETKISTTTPRG